MTEESVNIPIDLFGNIFRSNLEEAVSHWSECPSYKNSEKNLQSKLFTTISAARNNAICRLSTIYSIDLFIESNNDFNIKTKSDINPLFQAVPASMIQIVTNAVQFLIANPEDFIKAIFEFSETNPNAASVFACLTFPAMYFYFITVEFVELAEKFLLAAINHNRNKLTIQLLSSFFDLFPRFQDVLWQRFEFLSSDESNTVLTAFISALELAFCHLTPSHVRIIEYIETIDRPFLFSFFFNQYFHVRARQHFSHAQSEIAALRLHKLIQIFEFAAANPSSPIADTLITIFKSTNVRTPSLSYATEFGIPTVYAVFSSYEIDILFDMFKIQGIIRKDTKLNKIRNKNTTKTSFGFVQYPLRKFMKSVKLQREPLLFHGEKHLLKSGNAEYARLWEHVKKISDETGMNPRNVLTHPNSPQIASVIRQVAISKDPNFLHYITMKMRNRAVRAQMRFEAFMVTKLTEYELSTLARYFESDTEILLSVLAHDLMLQRCVSSGHLEEFVFVKKPRFRRFVKQLFRQNLFPGGSDEVRHAFFSNVHEMQSPEFDKCFLAIGGNIHFLALLLTIHLINEWQSGCSEIEERFALVAECLRCMLFGTPEYYNVVQNPRLASMLVDINRMSEMHYGTQILELSQLLSQIRVVGENCGLCANDKEFVQLAQNVLIFSGYDSFITILIWVERLSAVAPRIIEDIPMYSEMRSIMANLIVEIMTHDRKLIDLINAQQRKIPVIE